MAISLDEYEKALTSLDEAFQFVKKTKDPATLRMHRDAAIQRFEFCVELAWKCASKTMGTNSRAPNVVIREMAQNGFILDPKPWFDFVEARNKTSHTYDEDVAKAVFEAAEKFLPEGKKLLQKLKSK